VEIITIFGLMITAMIGTKTEEISANGLP